MDFATLVGLGALVALVTVPVVIVDRLMAGAEGPTLADIFAIPANPPLPRGMQEEELVRWHVERLQPRTPARAAREAAARAGVGHGRPVVETGGCR